MQVPMTPTRILKRATKLYPDKTAVVDGRIRLTYRQVYQRACRVCHLFGGMDIPPKSRVAVLDYNTHRYMALYFGMAMTDRVLLPLNTRLSEDDYTYILNDAQARVLVFHSDFAPMISAIKERLTSVTQFVMADGQPGADWITGSYDDLLAAASDTQVYCEPDDENDTLNLYYTSGTTGNPKGVMLTHRNIYANALTTIISFKLEDATIWHHIAPLFHLADAFFIWSVTYQGGTHVMQRTFDPAGVLETMQREKITAAMMVPTMINFLLNVPDLESYDLSSLKWIMVGGAPMSPANAKRMMDRLGCQYVSGYGLTETCPLLTVGNIKETLKERPQEEVLEYLTRTGLEVPGVDLMVVDPKGDEVPWDGRTVGEIIARGDNVMKGYWHLDQETETSIQNGYFYTGDLATVDPEGYLLIVDRAKDIIISGGENISSVEVENCLYQHPDVLECAVIAVADEKWGEVPKAVVALKPGAQTGADELMEFAKSRLAAFKSPKSIAFTPELPKTASGKILKTKLRQDFQS